MPTSRTLVSLLLGALLAVGCAPAAGEAIGATEDALGEEVAAAGIYEGTIEGDGVLLLVNDRQNTDADSLLMRARVPDTVAQAIVAYRKDAEGKDRWFKTLAELDAIPGTTTEVFQQLLTHAQSYQYTDEGELVPPLSAIDYPATPPYTFERVKIEAGFDQLTPDQVLELVRSRVPNDIHHSNERYLRDTIVSTHKSFTLAVNNLFVTNAPFASWLRGLNADSITVLGTMSYPNPVVLRTEKDGVYSYWTNNGGTYVPMDWDSHPYPVTMRAHIRLETDPAGAGVRIFYPACNLKVLENPTFVVIES